MKAQKHLEKTNKHLPSEEQLQLKFSKGWAERLKKLFCLRFGGIHGIAKRADTEMNTNKMPRIHMLVTTIDECDT